MKAMSMRERMLAFVQGRDHDRVPFVQYSGIAAPNQEVWNLVGRGNIGLLQWSAVHRLETPHCRFVTEDIVRDGKRGFRRVLITPEGELSEERLVEPTFGTSSAATHFVKAPDDYRALMAYFRDIVVHQDLSMLAEATADLGDDGLPHVAVSRSPYQQLWVEWVDIQDLSAHLVECPALMEEVIALMRDVERRIFEVVCAAARETAIPYIDVPDNITAPMIGVHYFRTHCEPTYRLLREMLDENGHDIPIFVHMDGDLKALWQRIAETPVRGLDSMSPPPDNDTSVADALAVWPAMRLGINFPSSVHLLEPEDIYRHTLDILAQGGKSGRLQIQISENVPPGVWRVSFPQIAKAINDFPRMS